MNNQTEKKVFYYTGKTRGDYPMYKMKGDLSKRYYVDNNLGWNEHPAICSVTPYGEPDYEMNPETYNLESAYVNPTRHSKGYSRFSEYKDYDISKKKYKIITAEPDYQ